MKDVFLGFTHHEELADFFGLTYAQLAGIIYRKDARFKYNRFTIPKKNGDARTIEVPTYRLKNLQGKLKDVLYEIYWGKPSVHGFVNGRSIVSNAQNHLDKQYIFNIDLQDYFGSIHFGRVRNLFMSNPLNFNREIATILAQICCFRNALPQGAPTSPIVANMITFKLDSQLQTLAKRVNATYTRYADDITFSFTCKRSRLPGEVIVLENSSVRPAAVLTRLIEENGFRINYEKVRLSGKHSRMEVTGLTVNEFPNVPRKYVKQVSSMLHAWEKFGYKAAESEYQKNYDCGHRATEKPKSFKYVIKGKLAFLRSVRGVRDSVFVKLAKRFNHLVESDLQFFIVEESEAERDAAAALWVIEVCYDHDGETKVFQGTGFDLESYGVVTCAHVVSDKDGLFREIKAFKSSNPSTFRRLQVNYLDRHRDIALCSLFDDLGNMIPLVPLSMTEEEGKQREEVTLLGFPQYAAGKSEHYIVDAKIASTFTRSSVLMFEIDQLIREGNSGGPIINVEGKVVGMAVEGATKSSGNNSAVHTSEIMKVSNVEYQVSKPD